uniref:Uncharacterized protein n=1 Tax=Timema shepardi TaxID=629360 RepID=A0A7R9FWM8_TIMSH|nr:unnamed protein product [Timema shepardi]
MAKSAVSCQSAPKKSRGYCSYGSSISPTHLVTRSKLGKIDFQKNSSGSGPPEPAAPRPRSRAIRTTNPESSPLSLSSNRNHQGRWTRSVLKRSERGSGLRVIREMGERPWTKSPLSFNQWDSQESTARKSRALVTQPYQADEKTTTKENNEVAWERFPSKPYGSHSVDITCLRVDVTELIYLMSTSVETYPVSLWSIVNSRNCQRLPVTGLLEFELLSGVLGPQYSNRDILVIGSPVHSECDALDQACQTRGRDFVRPADLKVCIHTSAAIELGPPDPVVGRSSPSFSREPTFHNLYWKRLVFSVLLYDPIYRRGVTQLRPLAPFAPVINYNVCEDNTVSLSSCKIGNAGWTLPPGAAVSLNMVCSLSLSWGKAAGTIPRALLVRFLPENLRPPSPTLYYGIIPNDPPSPFLITQLVIMESKIFLETNEKLSSLFVAWLDQSYLQINLSRGSSRLAAQTL